MVGFCRGKMASPSKKAKKPIITKMFNDPIHGSMELHPLLIKIIDTPQFQRLRFIKQLGGVYFVYPGASHNRFEHSIGVGYLAGKLAEALRSRQPELNITDRDVLCVQIAGLCHDLGHGPFSHLYDGLFLPKALEKKRKLKKWKHENGSCDMLDHLLKENNLEPVMEKYGLKPEEDITFIKEMIAGPLQQSKEQEASSPHYWDFKGRPEEKSFLYEIVSNKRNGVDVDKFDYLARDSLYLEIKNTFDFHRFLQFARVCEVDGRKTICTRDIEEDNMYDLFYIRHRLHKRAYQHRVNKVIEHMIAEAFFKADGHMQIKGSGGRMFTLSTAIEDMEAYTKLTDNVFEEILKSSCSELKQAREILQNIISRKIYKFVGERKQEDPIEDWKSQITGWKEGLAEGKRNLTSEDFEILVINMDYGMKDKNPVEHMHFYSKKEPDVAKPMSPENESSIGTLIFSEQLIRVFCKKIDEQSVEAARQHFEQWMKPNLDGSEEAMEILQNIVSRKIYKFVGETKPGYPIKDWKSRISGWKEGLAQLLPDEEENNLKPEDFEILVIEMDYGMDDKDPIQHVHFYSKSELDKAKPMPEEKGSRIRTTCFSEQLIRVFCKKIDDKSVEAAKKHFKQWLEKNPYLDESEEARKIQQKIVSGEIYKFVGERKQKDPIKDWKSRISGWKEGLAQPLPDEEENNLKPEDFEILVINMDYGMKDKNPVQHMDFYSKKEPDVAKPMSPENAPSIGTENFSEQLIRVFCKKIDEQSVEAARQQFEQWMKPNLDGSEEAMEILQNIVSRKIYKCVGETKPGYPIKDWKSQISGWKKVLAQPLPDEEENNLTSEDFEILVINKDYGMKDENSKNESRIGTEIFSEQLIRVFCKKIDEQSVEAAKKHYDQWLEKEPNLVGPEEARKIPQNIVSFESYKCVGETKPEYPIEDWESRISGWKKVLAQPLPDEEENNLKPEDFEILVINKDYGMKDENSKNAPSIGTTIFSEQLIRVFCKKIDEQSVEAARQHFKQW
ncbi:uncharacterized protein [Labrus bergylta]|uniref:uncharacterized protein isoform X6 n=1 Tax=Labrus bergylta TaxID=56723 RepID=UPI0033144002